MRAFSRLVLRAKAWKVFLVVVGTYAVGQVATLNSITAASNPGIPISSNHMIFMALTAAICTSVVFIWLWLLGISLNALTEPRIRQNATFLGFALGFTICYFSVLSLAVLKPNVLSVIGPVSILALICAIYALNFVAQALVLAETHTDPAFYDYAGPFFLLWLFPIGIWIVQPRINRLYAEEVARNAGT